jgi:hypothetical protein
MNSSIDALSLPCSSNFFVIAEAKKASLTGIAPDDALEACLAPLGFVNTVTVTSRTTLNQQRALWLNKEGVFAIRQGAMDRKAEAERLKREGKIAAEVARREKEEKAKQAKDAKDLKASVAAQLVIVSAANADAPLHGPPRARDESAIQAVTYYCGNITCGNEVDNTYADANSWIGCCGKSCKPQVWVCGKAACKTQLTRHINTRLARDILFASRK